MAAEEDRDERKRRKQAKKERKKVKSEEKAVKKRKRESSSSESIATNGSKHGSNGNHDAAGPTITRPRANSSMSHHSTTEDIITGRMGAPATISDRMFANHGEDDLVEGCPYQVKKIRTLVSLAPSSLKDVQGNIRRLSCEDITRYVGGLGGILMAVRKVKFDRTASGAAGRVLNELPHVHFNVEAEVVVFCPEVGSRLKGVVNECFPSHVGILVDTLFNAMVPADQLRNAGYDYDAETNQWSTERDANTGELLPAPVPVAISDGIDFTVQKMHECNGIISLEGSKPDMTQI